MAQVAENPDVRFVLRQLVMDRRGCGIDIRPLARYPGLVPGLEGLQFREAAEHLRGLGDTAIGYVALSIELRSRPS